MIVGYCGCGNSICMDCQRRWARRCFLEELPETCPYCRRSIRHHEHIVVEHLCAPTTRVYIHRSQHQIKVYTITGAGAEKLVGQCEFTGLQSAVDVIGQALLGDSDAELAVRQVQTYHHRVPRGDVDVLYETCVHARDVALALRVFLATMSLSWRQYTALDAELYKRPISLRFARSQRTIQAQEWIAGAFVNLHMDSEHFDL